MNFSTFTIIFFVFLSLSVKVHGRNSFYWNVEDDKKYEDGRPVAVRIRPPRLQNKIDIIGQVMFKKYPSIAPTIRVLEPYVPQRTFQAGNGIFAVVNV